jgi:hypothetical protein
VEKALLPPLAQATISEHLWNINTFVRPKLGSLEVNKVKPSDIVFMLETAGRTWQITKKILTTTKQVFSGGVGKRLIEYNPAAGIDLKAVIGPKPQARKRVMLSEKELGARICGHCPQIRNGYCAHVTLRVEKSTAIGRYPH